MRILAIRGCNLASLRGEFELDLATGALADVGLFAISGPTGAGKSTLLDAMCLALFDTTPRLQGRTSVRVGRHDVDEGLRENAQDVRALLSKGAGHGFAEVEFRAIDGHVYRSRWSVRRARNRANGRLQGTDYRLWRLRGDDPELVAGGKKGEWEQAVQGALGLSFDQFRRSVLLAQGEFAAFLRATGAERAELLERITGTEVFAAVSREIYRRDRELRDELRVIDDKLATLGVMEADDRESCIQRIGELAAERARLLEAAKRAEQLADWIRQRASWGQAVAAAQARWRVASHRHDEQAPQRTRMELVQRASGLRQASREAAQQAALGAALADRLGLAEAAAEAAVGSVGAASAAVDGATQQKQELAAQWADREPEIDAARRADAVVVERQRGVEALARARNLAAEPMEAAGARVLHAQREHEALTQRLATLANWLRDHAPMVALSEQWERGAAGVRPQLVEFVQSQRELATAERAHQQASESWKAALAAAETAASNRADAEARSAQAQALAVAAQEQLALLRPEDAEVEWAQAIKRDSEWAALREGWEAGLSLRLRAEQAHRRQERLQHEQQRAGEAAETAKNARIRAEGAFEEAERQWVWSQRSASLAEHRSTLRSGEPCPLCGATSHPLVDGTATVDADSEAESASKRVKALRAEIAQWAERAVEAATQADAARTQREEVESEAADIASHIQGANKRVRERAEALGLDLAQRDALAEQGTAERGTAECATEAGPDWPPQWERSRGEHAGWVAKLQEKRAQIAAGRIESERLRKELEQARVSAQQAAAQRDAAVARKDALQTAAHEKERLVERLRALTDALSRALDGPLSAAGLVDWEERARSDGERFVASLQAQVAEAASRVAERPELEARELKASEALRASIAAREVIRLQCEEAEKRLADAQATLESAQEDRATMLGGRSVAEVLKERQSAEDGVARALQQAERALSEAREEQSRARAVAEGLRGQLAEAREAEAAAIEAGRRARVELELTEEQAAAVVAVTDEQLDEWRRGLAAIDKEYAEARVSLEERKRRLAEHEQTRPEPPAPGAIVPDVPEAPETEAPETEAPETEAPETEAPETEAPETEAPETEAPETEAPETEAPETDAPDTDAPASEVPESGQSVAVPVEAAESDNPEWWLERSGAWRDQAATVEEAWVSERSRLSADDGRVQQAGEWATERAAIEARREVWGALNSLIGSADGKRFRELAQGLTLDELLCESNAKLEELAPRYALQRVPDHDLELQIIDLDMGGEIRSTASLSGGEGFLVSLALALGLSEMASDRVPVGSLFIDEGFGTLDTRSLDVALATLDALQATGRQVGVISHVEGLADRLGVGVRIEPTGNGRSELVITR